MQRLWHPTTLAEAQLLYGLSVDQNVRAFAQLNLDRALDALLNCNEDELITRWVYARSARDVRDALIGAPEAYAGMRDMQHQQQQEAA